MNYGLFSKAPDKVQKKNPAGVFPLFCLSKLKKIADFFLIKKIRLPALRPVHCSFFLLCVVCLCGGYGDLCPLNVKCTTCCLLDQSGSKVVCSNLLYINYIYIHIIMFCSWFGCALYICCGCRQETLRCVGARSDKKYK